MKTIYMLLLVEVPLQQCGCEKKQSKTPVRLTVEPYTLNVGPTDSDPESGNHWNPTKDFVTAAKDPIDVKFVHPGKDLIQKLSDHGQWSTETVIDYLINNGYRPLTLNELEGIAPKVRALDAKHPLHELQILTVGSVWRHEDPAEGNNDIFPCINPRLKRVWIQELNARQFLTPNWFCFAVTPIKSGHGQ